jgi:hypothetical protein
MAGPVLAAGACPGQASDPVEQAYLHSIFGAIFARQESYDRATEHCWQARAGYQAADHRAGRPGRYAARDRWLHGQQGRYGEATHLIHDAMAIYRELDDANGEGDCWLRPAEAAPPGEPDAADCRLIDDWRWPHGRVATGPGWREWAQDRG